ncbi:MAG: hypothetical protein K8S97_17165, partial [Anaerolineae bacterium]|nr:hypothetical protein [Anaerolineae bacterium]
MGQRQRLSGARELPAEGLTTRVALLAIAGGRVAIVRGLAPTNVWQAGGEGMFTTLAESLHFSLPERAADFMEDIPSNDGGVLWHFISRQPDSGRVVNIGGITFDQFGVMYIVAGPGGVLALDMPTGAQISYMGPWYSGNFVDVAIGVDTKLYTVNPADGTSQAIMVVDRAGNWTRAWGVVGDGPGEFAPGMPQTIVVTPANEVWTVSEGHSSGVQNRLYKFDTFGNLLLTVDLATINPDLRGVRLDNNIQTGAIYLVGADGNLNVVDHNGEALVVNLAQEVLHDQDPVDIAIAPNGNIIVALPAPGLEGAGFLELSVAGQLLDVFGFPFDEMRGGPFLPGEYRQPAGLIVGPDGTVYWTETHPDSGYNQVQRFTFTGDGVLPLGAEMAAGEAVEGDLLGSADPSRGGGTIAYGQSVKGALNNRYP